MVQPEADGTGGALRAAREVIDDAETVLVLSGDHPLISAGEIAGWIDAHRATGAAATVMTTELDDPGTYGRVVRGADGGRRAHRRDQGPGTPPWRSSRSRRSTRAPTPSPATALADALERLSDDNAQGEYYLPDVLP